MANDTNNLLTSYVKVTVSADRMRAIGTFSARPVGTGDFNPQAQMLAELLQERGIVFGIESTAHLQSLLDEWINPMEGIVLAQGEAPSPSVNDALEYHFDTNRKASPTEQKDGTVDYRELGILQNATAGALLISKIPGTAGSPGTDVFGKPIAVKPPVRIALASRATKGTVVNAEGTGVFAAIDGQIMFGLDNRVSVSPVFHVNGSVDFSTGNIDFRGSVVVHENVHSGFVIRASGNIEIFGIVEAASLFSEGDIVVRGGVQGSSRTRIETQGSLHALYLQNSVVVAKGDVLVTDSIMHSNIRANSVSVTGKRGLLVGGDASVTHSVQARVVGSPLATNTGIHIVHMKSELSEELQQVNQRIAQSQETVAKVQEAFHAVEAIHKKGATLSPQQKIMVSRLRSTLSETMSELSELEAKRTDLLSVMANLVQPFVHVTGELNPGVHLHSFAGDLVIDERLGSCKFLVTEHGWERLIG